MYDVQQFDAENGVFIKYELLKFIYCCQKFTHMEPFTQQMNVTFIINYLQCYHPSRISYRSTCAMMNYLDQHPNYIAYWMILIATVLNVSPFNLIIRCILLNMYSRIRLLVFQVFINTLHSHWTSITVIFSDKNKRHPLFNIHMAAPWIQDDT